MLRRFLFAGTLSLASAVALAVTHESGDVVDFNALDADGDSQITRTEYDSYVRDSDRYTDWDINADGLLDENEYDAIGWDSEFDTLDADNDSLLDVIEFYDGVFNELDEDENLHIDGDEWDDAGDTGLFDV